MMLQPSRRQAIAGVAALSAAVVRGASKPAETWLLIDKSEIDAARERARKFPWAKAALDQITSTAGQALKAEVKLPDRGGQWPHWYSCKLDGVQLETRPNGEHRCPKCGTIYRGEPYDSVVLYGIHSRYSRFVESLGLAYRFTGEAAYAKHAAEFLLAYAAKYNTYPRHNTNGEDKVGGGRMSAQTLDESVWLIPMASGYALVRDTLTAAERERVEKDLFVAAADVIREHHMSIHNIQCWKNTAVGLAGYVASREDLVKEAIDDPARGFRVQMAKGVTDDGLWYEGSLGYHAYMMHAIWPLAEAARHHGLDLCSDRMRSLWDAPLALALPDGNSPGFNDNNGGNVVGLGSLYEYAYARWQRPEYGRVASAAGRRGQVALLYGADTVPDGPIVPEESKVLKSAGFAMLRAGGPTSVAMRFGQHGGGHGHPDKLNIVTYGVGRLWGLDPGSINYGVPLHREWYRTTIAHNTVTVDGGVQTTADGTLRQWLAEKDATTITAAADNVFPGVRLSRTVTARAGSLDDRFECNAAQEHVYDWAFHSAGRMTTSLETKSVSGHLGPANGYQHLENIASASTAGDWWVKWEAEGTKCTLRVKGAPGTEVFTAVAPGKRPADRVPLVIVRRRTANTVFEVRHEFAKA